MATSRHARTEAPLDGPFPVRLTDITALNGVFSDAFTERYRRDGMVGVRVPFLNPLIWRYAIDGAGAGAMLWRDERGAIRRCVDRVQEAAIKTVSQSILRR